MKSDDLCQAIHLNWYTTLFLLEAESCRKSAPSTSIDDLMKGLFAKHPFLQMNKDRFTLTHQGLMLNLAYSFLVLPFESDEDIRELKSDIRSLAGFKIRVRPGGFGATTAEWLKYLRHAFAHGNIEINPQKGPEGDECWVFWNHPGGDRSKPRNFEVTCSYVTLANFMDEYTKMIVHEVLNPKMASVLPHPPSGATN